MGKRKTTTTQQNTYGHIDTPITPQMQALQAMKAKADPNIPYYAATERKRLENSYSNPFGSYTPPAVQEALRRNTSQGLAQQEAQAMAESQFNADNANFNRQAMVAQMTQPKFVQTGGTSTQTQSGGFWGDLLLGGTQGSGAAALA